MVLMDNETRNPLEMLLERYNDPSCGRVVSLRLISFFLFCHQKPTELRYWRLLRTKPGMSNTEVKDIEYRPWLVFLFVVARWTRSQVTRSSLASEANGCGFFSAYLPHHTIGENITYGDNTRDVPYQEIEGAAYSANAHYFIMRLPKVLNHVLRARVFYGLGRRNEGSGIIHFMTHAL